MSPWICFAIAAVLFVLNGGALVVTDESKHPLKVVNVCGLLAGLSAMFGSSVYILADAIRSGLAH